jgi:hypothetical protein
VRLTLTDSVFHVLAVPGSDLWLPMNGEKVQTPGRSGKLEVRVTWRDLSPTMERSISGAGEIKETLELLTDDRLLLTRVVSIGTRSASARLLFDRAPAAGAP